MDEVTPYTTLVNGEALPLIDVREPPLARSVRGAVRVPASAYESRWHEWPPRCARYALLVDASAACAAVVATILGADGLCEDLGAVIYEADASFWDSVPAALRVEGAVALSPRLRLWRPGLLAARLSAQWRAWRLPRDAALLDVGCGHGRSAVFLLQEAGYEDGGGGGGGGGARLRLVALDKRRVLAHRLGAFAAGASAARVLLHGVAGAPPEVLALGAPGGHMLHVFVADACAYIAGAAARLAAGAAAGADAGAPPTAAAADTPPDAFDVVFFSRNTLKPAMAAAVPLLVAAARASGSALLAVESFHGDAPHPALANQKLVEGELEALVRGVLASVGGEWVVECVHESRETSEDGRPMLLAAVRLAVVRA